MDFELNLDLEFVFEAARGEAQKQAAINRLREIEQDMRQVSLEPMNAAQADARPKTGTSASRRQDRETHRTSPQRTAVKPKRKPIRPQPIVEEEPYLSPGDLPPRPESYPPFTHRGLMPHQRKDNALRGAKIHTLKCDQHRWRKLQEKDRVSRERFNYLLSKREKKKQMKIRFQKRDSCESDDDAATYLHNYADDVEDTIINDHCICHARNM